MICEKCGKEFEEKSSMIGWNAVKCPHCGYIQIPESMKTSEPTPVEKRVLKDYLDFVDTTEKKTKELMERIDQCCHGIGCKSDDEEPFMECNKGCPLFYAWQFLDKILKTIEGDVNI